MLVGQGSVLLKLYYAYESPEILLPCRFVFSRPWWWGWAPTFCFSNEFPGDVDSYAL